MAKFAPFDTLTGTAVRVKVVDIGANPIDGQPPYAPLLSAGVADLVGFEPNPTALAKLEAAKGPNELYLPHAVADGAEHILKLCVSSGMTSLFEPNPAVLSLFHGFPEWGRVIDRIPVRTVRLDDVPETLGMDYLKIDIQGGEAMVFAHGRDRLREAVIVHTEVEFLPLYQGQPLFSDVDALLRDLGFIIHRFSPVTSRVISPLLVDGNVYGGLSQIVWADAIFVKDFTKIQLISDAQLLRMAKILHECYESIDLCLYLLREYDRRQGTDLASAYFSGLQAAPGAAAG